MTEISRQFQILGQLCNFRNFRTAGTPESMKSTATNSSSLVAEECHGSLHFSMLENFFFLVRKSPSKNKMWV